MKLKIVNVKITNYESPKTTSLGFFDVEFGEEFVIRGFRILKLKSNNQIIISTPSKKIMTKRDGEQWFDIVQFKKASSIYKTILGLAKEVFGVDGTQGASYNQQSNSVPRANTTETFVQSSVKNTEPELSEYAPQLNDKFSDDIPF